MKKIISLTAVALLLTACGREAIFDNQADQRDDVRPELIGNWGSLCEGKQIVTVTLAERDMQIQQRKFYDAECTDAQRTVTHRGTYKLAHTFKEGILNSIVFESADSFDVMFHSETEVDARNNDLAKIQNEKEAEITPTTTASDRRRITRSNMQIRQGKQVKMWRRDELQTLNRLQTEKLGAYGLGETPIVDFDDRAAFQYQLDNGYLQLTAPKIGTRVYVRQ